MSKRVSLTPKRREALSVILGLANENCTGATPEFMNEYQHYFTTVHEMLYSKKDNKKGGN